MTADDLSQIEMSFFNPEQGDPAPRFAQRSLGGTHFNLSNLGGGYVVLCFFPSSKSPVGQAILKVLEAKRSSFDGKELRFVGVTLDAYDETEKRLQNDGVGVQFICDLDGHVSKLYGALPCDFPQNISRVPFRALGIVLDRRLRVVANVSFLPDGSDADKLLPVLDRLPPLAHAPEPELIPPILVVPQIFTPELCRHLISLYETNETYESGFMSQDQSKTLTVMDYGFKRRRDYQIEDEKLINSLKALIWRRLVPEIKTAFQFDVTRVERQIVACYSAEDGGHFNAHRDNTTLGTAHRRFAITFNLNENYEGGDLMFPEFGTHSFRAPVGGAIVFSCSLLHAAGLVTKGTRYAYLPFLYDDAAAAIREANQSAIVPLPNSSS